jgi:predicted aspartyl protease
MMTISTINVEIATFGDDPQWRRVELLLDSGMLHSVIPAGVLNSLGVTAYTEQQVHMDDGLVRRPRGAIQFRLGNRVGIGDVLFGEDGDASLIGTVALASLGLMFDPLKRELRDLPMLLARMESVA